MLTLLAISYTITKDMYKYPKNKYPKNKFHYKDNSNSSRPNLYKNLSSNTGKKKDNKSKSNIKWISSLIRKCKIISYRNITTI